MLEDCKTQCDVLVQGLADNKKDKISPFKNMKKENYDKFNKIG